MTSQIRLRAERRAGELLREMAETEQRQTKGGAGTGRPSEKTSRSSSTNSVASVPALKSLGITRDQSSDWQKLAKIPEGE